MELTQHEVADQLGISRGTLHRVLSGSPLVKPSTRQRVEKALAELGYSPNIIAQGLRTGRTRTIGLIAIGDAKISEVEKARAIHEAARLRGYSLVLTYSDGSAESEARCVEELRARKVDGLIVTGKGRLQDSAHFKKLIKARVGLVAIAPIPSLETDSVVVDAPWAYGELTRHVIAKGHRDIGLLLEDIQSTYAIAKEKGVSDALTAAGLPVNKAWMLRVPVRVLKEETVKVRSVSDYRLGFDGALKFFQMDRRPTAIICQSDQTAIGFQHAAKLHNVDVPGDIALTGYDDIPAAEFARVPLTTMHQPEAELGVRAVELLMRRMEGDWSGFPQTVVLRPTLIERESCSRPGVKT